MQDLELLDEKARQFLECEADYLDNKEYEAWLSLWDEAGLYIVPVDHSATDFENSVNVAYDNSEMRSERVRRLTGGEAVSTSNSLPTVRTLSRFRLLENTGTELTVRCAYCLFVNNKNGIRQFPANVEFVLKVTSDGYKILRKVVRIMKSDEYLTTVSFLF